MKFFKICAFSQERREREEPREKWIRIRGGGVSANMNDDEAERYVIYDRRDWQDQHVVQEEVEGW